MSDQERAQQIADEHNGDAYSVALHLAGRENEIRWLTASHEKEIQWLKQHWREEIDDLKRQKSKIKAEAVREVAVEVFNNTLSSKREIEAIFNYAKKLENQND